MKTQCASTIVRKVNFLTAVIAATWFAFLPLVVIVSQLDDPGFTTGQIPRLAFRLHHAVSPRIQQWARDRIASGRAAQGEKLCVAGQEWPLFGSVFYLWATEALQEAWEKDHSRSTLEPRVYARGAIEASTALVTDPVHATWVKQFWGAHYMENGNLFYRYLQIASMTSYTRLTNDTRYLTPLRQQVESLAEEIDNSPSGLLDDYPDECFPADVMAAVLCIRHADQVLGTDHTAFAQRALRAFQHVSVDRLGLPVYQASAPCGAPVSVSRGCANSYMGCLAPELWPDAATQWHETYTRNFWQRRWGADGFREFAKSDTMGADWYWDVDAGPLIAGHGFAACAFGLGAARANGRLDQAYALAMELLATSWPSANGRLYLPRILSNAADAPYLGESCILYILSRTPVLQQPAQEHGTLPPLVYTMLVVYAAAGCTVIFAAHRAFWVQTALPIRTGRAQTAAWCLLWPTGIVLMLAGYPLLALLALAGTLMLPRSPRRDNSRPAGL